MVNGTRIREAVGVFEDMEDLRKAVSELEGTQFSRESISMLGNKNDIEKQFGLPEIPPALAENNRDAPRQPPIRTEEKAIGLGVMIGSCSFIAVTGTLLATGADVDISIILTATIAGGVIGYLLAKITEKYFGRHIQKQIEKGGMVLWVKTHNAKREKIAYDILIKHGAKHVHIN